MTERPALWRCPECGRSFANRNQSHACGRHDLEAHFARRPPEVRELFDAFLAALEEIGPVEVLPQLEGHFVLARRVENPRFLEVTTFSPRNHLHRFRIRRPEEIDAEFMAWMREAYAVGEQRHLD